MDPGKAIDFYEEKKPEIHSNAGIILKIAAAVAVFVFGFLTWYYSERIETLKQQLAAAHEDISRAKAETDRYRVALGIDKASAGSLIELTNDELRAKSLKTAADLRSLCASFRQREEAFKARGAVKTKAQFDQLWAMKQGESDEIAKSIRSDVILVDNELRRRLDPKAIAAIPGLAPSMMNSVTRTPIEPLAMGSVGGSGFGFTLCVLSEGIEQMAKLLPDDNGKH